MSQEISSDRILHRVHYFVPREVRAIIEFNAEAGKEADMRPALAEFARNAVSALGFGEVSSETAKSEDVVILSRGTESAFNNFALVPVKGLKLEQSELVTQYLLAAEALRVDQQLETGAKYRTAEMSLRSVAPNWLNGGAQGACVTGGPGSSALPPFIDAAGLPLPLPDQATLEAAIDFTITEWETIEAAIQESPNKSDGKVVVFVLDTVPTEAMLNRVSSLPTAIKVIAEDVINNVEIVRAADISASAQAEIDALNNPNTWLTLAEIASGHQGGLGYLSTYGFPMPDHGLFIAGTVRRIAPNAEIILVQVLDDNGVGTEQLLSEGLAYVRQRLAQRTDNPRVVVNCSLTLVAPRSAEHILPVMPPVVMLDNPAMISQVINNFAQFQQAVADYATLYLWIQQALQLTAQGAQLIAAAGNEGNAVTGAHPPARYPAALSGIIGVGALDETDLQAWYSNISDTPLPDGYNTFGGGTESNVGMLGVYLYDFPVSAQSQSLPNTPSGGKQNDYGCARWAGTSFATGVISGVVAKMAGQLPVPDALAILQSLPDTPAGLGQIVIVDQG